MKECNVDISVDIIAYFDFGKDGIETILNEGYVQTIGRVTAKAVGSVNGAIVVEEGIEIENIALTPISIPGVFTLGPQAVLEIGAFLEIGEDIRATFGAYVIWESIVTKIDFKDGSQSYSSGWSPDRTEPKFSLDADIVIKVGVYAEAKIELALEAFGGIVSFAAGASAKASAGASLAYDPDSLTCSGGVEIGAFAGVELGVYVEGSVGSWQLLAEEYIIFEIEFPIPGSWCIGGSTVTTPSLPPTRGTTLLTTLFDESTDTPAEQTTLLTESTDTVVESTETVAELTSTLAESTDTVAESTETVAESTSSFTESTDHSCRIDGHSCRIDRDGCRINILSNRINNLSYRIGNHESTNGHHNFHRTTLVPPITTTTPPSPTTLLPMKIAIL